jgi:hypothetical protein
VFDNPYTSGYEEVNRFVGAALLYNYFTRFKLFNFAEPKNFFKVFFTEEL